ncbi:hypothetical protein GCM10023116_16220 [Kistimonas scapharcae]|uniref:RCK C-terminal domain-containing protein n=1 Tax=Kistimonas scapharcae TaxID=1036133 RepID=A0ABP8UZJ7_9GAMM
MANAELNTPIPSANVVSIMGKSAVVGESRLEYLIQQAHSIGHYREMSTNADDTVRRVATLFDVVLAESAMSPSVKTLLEQLQIPLLKAALIDGVAFSRESHPARKLLNELGRAGIQCRGDVASPDPLHRLVEKAVAAIQDQFVIDTSVFEQVLIDFNTRFVLEQQRQQRLLRRQQQTTEAQQRADSAKELIRNHLDTVLNGLLLPEHVLDFMHGSWGHYLFIVYLKEGDGSDAWQRGLKTLDYLIATLRLTQQERREKVLPKLFAVIRQSLDSIGFDKCAIDEQLQRLTRFYKEQPNIPVTKAAQESDKDKCEEHSGTSAESKASSDNQNAIERTIDTRKQRMQVGKQVDQFKPGLWVTLLERNGEQIRAKLSAVLRSDDRYVFVNQQGDRVKELSRTELIRAICSGFVQLMKTGA